MRHKLEFETWSDETPQGRERLDTWNAMVAGVKWTLVGTTVILALMATFLV